MADADGNGVGLVAPNGGGTAMAGVAAALFEPIEAPTAFEATVAKLGSAVRLGILPPGSRLPSERELAERFEISRGTLRQALTALGQSGLLLARRGRSGGTWVVDMLPPASETDQPSSDDFNRRLDARLAIEAGSALLAVRQSGRWHLDALQAAHDEITALIESGAKFDEYRQADVRFHFILAEASGSAEYMARTTEVQDSMTELLGLGSRPRVVLEKSNEQHQEIIDALRRGEGGAAAAAVCEHIEATRLIIEGLGRRDDER